MQIPDRTWSSDKYRYGFNGKEKDEDGEFGSTTSYDYGFRIYNPAIGKFLSVDPLMQTYPYYTPYQFAGNTPIIAIDIDGLETLVKINSRSITLEFMSLLKNKGWNHAIDWLVCHQDIDYPEGFINQPFKDDAVDYDWLTDSRATNMILENTVVRYIEDEKSPEYIILGIVDKEGVANQVESVRIDYNVDELYKGSWTAAYGEDANGIQWESTYEDGNGAEDVYNREPQGKDVRTESPQHIAGQSVTKATQYWVYVDKEGVMLGC